MTDATKVQDLFATIAEKYEQDMPEKIEFGDLSGDGLELRIEVELAEDKGVSAQGEDDEQSYPYLVLELLGFPPSGIVATVRLCWWSGGVGQDSVSERQIWLQTTDEQMATWFKEKSKDFEVAAPFIPAGEQALRVFLRCAKEALSAQVH